MIDIIKQGMEASKDAVKFREWSAQWLRPKPWQHNSTLRFKYFGIMQIGDGSYCNRCGKEFGLLECCKTECPVPYALDGPLEVWASRARESITRLEWEKGCGYVFVYLENQSEIPAECQGLSHWVMSWATCYHQIIAVCVLLEMRKYKV